jgi:hypothetical protein
MKSQLLTDSVCVSTDCIQCHESINVYSTGDTSVEVAVTQVTRTFVAVEKTDLFFTVCITDMINTLALNESMNERIHIRTLLFSNHIIILPFIYLNTYISIMHIAMD